MVKMRLIAGLLALLVFLCFAGPCTGDFGRELVLLFKGEKTEVPYEEDSGEIIMRKPRSFRVPAFVGGLLNNEEFLAVFCDSRYDGFSDWSFIEAAARTSYGDYRRWSDVEIFAKNTRKSKTHSVVGDITAVMKGNKIFALAPHWDESTYVWTTHGSNEGWNPIMIVGTVTNSTEAEGGDVFIKWDKGTSLKHLLPKTVLGAQGFQFIGGVGNGVVTKKGAIVFPIQIANKKGQNSPSIMYSTDEGSTWQMGEVPEAGPSEGSVVEWGDGKLLLFTRYDKGFRKAYESDDMGNTWKESLVFSRVWGNQLERAGYGCQGSATTAPVDGKDVLLFTHPLDTARRYSHGTLLLWLSDGQRILCVGRISEDGKGERAGYSILTHVGDNLYSVHEINAYGSWDNYDAKLEEWDRIIALSPLPDFFESVKKTVRAWRQLDLELQTAGVPTEGLVGFLGDSNDDAEWTDRYYCVNATVNGATRVPGGFRFNATRGSGAQWPVQSQGQNQVYIFTREQFTIAATVTIHTTSETEDDSLLGASEDAQGNRVLLGIGYTKDKSWYTVNGKGEKIPTETSLELEKEYHVAITFANGVGSVYVDGVEITNGKLTTPSTASISHFYMGGIGESSTAMGTSCTVKNAMLFSRALGQTEIAGISGVDKDGDQNEPTSTAEPTSASGDDRSAVTAEPTETSEDDRSAVTAEPTETSEDDRSAVTAEPTETSEDDRSAVTTEPTETSLCSQTFDNGSGDANTEGEDLLKGDFYEEEKSDSAELVSLSFAA